MEGTRGSSDNRDVRPTCHQNLSNFSSAVQGEVLSVMTEKC